MRKSVQKVSMRASLLLAVGLFPSVACRLHEATPDLGPERNHRPWQVHCETAKSHVQDPDAAPGVHHPNRIWAHGEDARPIKLAGSLEDGFFVVRGLLGDAPPGEARLVPTAEWLRNRCLATIAEHAHGEPLELGRVTAARRHEGIDATIVFPESRVDSPVSRIVVFGDSLSDTGLLKRRLHVLPKPPYWLGRFSNGPVWVDYVEAHGRIFVQNHSYGGAAITHHEHIPGESLFRRLEERGQFFVSGSTGHQVDDYIERELIDGEIQRADETAYVFWAGANEYISKEPVSAVITTFLNLPDHEAGYQRVADEAIAALEDQVRRLHEAGARRYVLIDLPDLGHTPIVLQNKGYLPDEPVDSEDGRRLELARRLSKLTNYHNDRLTELVQRLRRTLTDSTFLHPQTNPFLTSIFEGRPLIVAGEPLEMGFSIEPQRAKLTYGGQTRVLHHPCYDGAYLGTDEPHKVCPNEAGALFWDVVHPTTYTHCWQAWIFEHALAAAGWTHAPEPARDRRVWCGVVSDRTLGMAESQWVFDPLELR